MVDQSRSKNIRRKCFVIILSNTNITYPRFILTITVEIKFNIGETRIPEDKLSMWNITIKIDGKKIEPSTHVKYLGILIHSFLNWNFHIDELSTKLSHVVGMLAKIRYYINVKTLSMVYHGIFSSLLLYGFQIWGTQ